ncbi:type 1 glutamine amidotransferase [Microbacterium sp. E-13]|uniref:type 1 glutamine amidotransferase n=1 Tax=Microbacterium sp. E-13 TaxID=3404048 RepID=UPI003CEAB6CA
MARVLVIEHEANAGIGLVGERMSSAGIEVDIVGPEVGRAVPSSTEGYDGVVVLGGTPGPQDDDTADWLPGVRAVMRASLDREVPLLGICLGAQLLAVVAGGTVGPVRSAAEVGLCQLRLTDASVGDPLLDGLPSSLEAMQWHFLEVHELPEGSVSLCESDRCANQAFRVGRSAWGVQFHLEALASTVADWALSGSEDLEAVGLSIDEVVGPMRDREAELREVWSLVADRWIGIVEHDRVVAEVPSSCGT